VKRSWNKLWLQGRKQGINEGCTRGRAERKDKGGREEINVSRKK
jgi:hypothetical protein